MFSAQTELTDVLAKGFDLLLSQLRSLGHVPAALAKGRYTLARGASWITQSAEAVMTNSTFGSGDAQDYKFVTRGKHFGSLSQQFPGV